MDEKIIRLSEENNNTSLTQALSSLKNQKVSQRDPFSLFITLIVCIVVGPRFFFVHCCLQDTLAISDH